jgi:hypothetical protein
VILEQEWDEKLGAWFRRDHAGRAFPSWVAGEISMFHEEDPGHESEWERLAASVEKGTLDVETDPLDWIGFLIHLRPFDASVPLTEPEEGDWFGAGQELRRPKTFPLGVSSREAKDPEYRSALSDLVGEAENEKGGAAVGSASRVAPVDVFSSVGWHDLTPIEGGPVAISPRHMARLFRLAWFATSSAHPEVYAEGPGVPALGPQFEACKGTGVQTDDTALRVGFEGPGGRFHALALIGACDPSVWTRFPEGTLLELATFAPGLDRSEEVEDAPETGTMRFRGTTRGQGDACVWEIQKSYPRVSAATLSDALALSAAAEEGPALPLRTPEEARAALDQFLKEWKFLFADDPPVVAGSEIRLSKANPSTMALLAAEAFRLRYADIWPFEPPDENPFGSVDEDADEDDDDDDDDPGS